MSNIILCQNCEHEMELWTAQPTNEIRGGLMCRCIHCDAKAYGFRAEDYPYVKVELYIELSRAELERMKLGRMTDRVVNARAAIKAHLQQRKRLTMVAAA